jgi:hypothetical protein
LPVHSSQHSMTQHNTQPHSHASASFPQSLIP